MCKVNKVFSWKEGAKLYGLYNIISDSKYTGDVYGVDKAFFLGKKGVIALVEDTMCNIYVLNTNTYEIESASFQ